MIVQLYQIPALIYKVLSLSKMAKKEYALDAAKRAKEMMEYPWFQNKEWQNQLKKALKEKVRIEQQALANKSLEFVATEYLPTKIKNKDFLP